MPRINWIVALLLIFGPLVEAADGLTTLPSQYGVSETMDRFENAVRDKGLKVFLKIDHEQGAKSVNMALRPTQLLIFGSPKVGTGLMQSNQLVGLDLPFKALAWEDAEGKVWLGYLAPADLLRRYGIADRPQIEMKVSKLLATLARTATMP